MSEQWFAVWTAICIAIGFLIAYYLKKGEIVGGILDLNDFLNTIRGEDHTLLDNVRFLIAHLQEGGPEKWSKLFPDLDDLNIEKAKAFLDGIPKEDILAIAEELDMK